VTVHYEVALDAAPGQVNEVTRFMVERHIGDVLDSGCFVSAHFMQESATRFRTAYIATSRDALDRYLAEHAPRIRNEFSKRFGDNVRMTRTVWEPRGDWWISLGAQPVVPSTAERLLGELRRSHNGDAWHGPSLAELITPVDAETAAATPIPGAHSIWELTRHITAWAREVGDRLSGQAPGRPAMGDWPPIPSTGAACWEAAQIDLRSAHGELLGAVASFPSARWDAPVGSAADAIWGTGLTFAAMVNGLVQHNAYHGGQIALLLRAIRAKAVR
jgi:uncharacterized damage-inducible protein DinB